MGGSKKASGKTSSAAEEGICGSDFVEDTGNAKKLKISIHTEQEVANK